MNTDHELHSSSQKTVIINRAVAGSGKTTISKCIAETVKAAGFSVVIHSTDDYFITALGTYDFIPENLREYHQKNLDAFCGDIDAEIDLVINDNTNLSSWQSKPYIEAAKSAGYQIIILEYVPRSLDEHVKSQIVTEDNPTPHGVLKETIIKMISDYNEFKNLLDKKHLTDNKVDLVIEILPNEFHSIKKNIGRDILNLMTQGKF